MVVSMGLVAWHQATVVHGRCAEHGEEIHLIKIADGGPVIADPATPAMTASDWLRLAGDEHCELLATIHATTTARAAIAAHTTIAAHVAPPVPFLPLAPPATLYRLAPKTSPPV